MALLQRRARVWRNRIIALAIFALAPTAVAILILSGAIRFRPDFGPWPGLILVASMPIALLITLWSSTKMLRSAATRARAEGSGVVAVPGQDVDGSTRSWGALAVSGGTLRIIDAAKPVRVVPLEQILHVDEGTRTSGPGLIEDPMLQISIGGSGEPEVVRFAVSSGPVPVPRREVDAVFAALRRPGS